MAEMLSPIETTEGGAGIGFATCPVAIVAPNPQTVTDATYKTTNVRFRPVFEHRAPAVFEEFRTRAISSRATFRSHSILSLPPTWLPETRADHSFETGLTASDRITAMAVKMVTALSATTVITGTIPAGLRRRQHSGKVVAVS